MTFQIPVGKQRDFCLNSDARVNFAHGAVRSAKTVGANVRWLKYVLDTPKEYNILMVGRTLTSLERNVLLPISKLVGPQNYVYKRSLKVARIYGRKIMVEGGNDESAYSKIAGLTLGGAYVDEASLIPQSFWDMLISRLSEKGAQLFTTSNPGNPSHYLKKSWLDREEELDLLSWHFKLTDNPWLDPAYVAELKRQYTGLFYQRYILGEWVAGEGAVYPNFQRDIHTVPSLPDGHKEAMLVSCDYGQTHPTAFLKAYRIKGVWYICEEYKRTNRTDSELSKDLQRFLDGKYPSAILVDPSAKSFRLQLQRDGVLRVRKADNAVLDGISRTSNAFSTGKLRIVRPACPQLLEEIDGYRWDPKASERGEDKPIKENDDLVDDLRYLANYMFKRG